MSYFIIYSMEMTTPTDCCLVMITIIAIWIALIAMMKRRRIAHWIMNTLIIVI